MMPLYQRPGTEAIWVRGSVAGHKYRKTTGTTDPKTAAEFEHRLREQLYQQYRLGDRSAVTFREVCQRWLKTLTNVTAMQDRSNIKWFLTAPGMADAMIRDINTEVLEELQGILREEGRAPATVNRMMGVLRRILRKASRHWEYMETVPVVPMYKLRKRSAPWLTREQFSALVEQLPEHLAIAARFAVHTGLRMSAQTSLRWSQVDLDARRAWVGAEDMKANDSHGFPLSSEAIRALQDARAFQARQDAEHKAACLRRGIKYIAHPQVHVFTYRGKRIGNCNTLAYQKALRAAGIEGANWHTLRHTFASWAVQSGVTLQELMQLGPWKSYKAVLIYAHLAPGGLHAAVERIAGTEQQAMR
jgi:integrase